MPGGEYDSSKTRVVPFFDRLRAADETAQSWLPLLLGLPSCGSGARTPSRCGPLRDWGWGDLERALDPPVSLLSWLIRNLEPPTTPDRSSAWPRRQRLIAREPAHIGDALQALRSDSSARDWYLLEGPSYPDAFLATDDLVVVIEGKRTEAGPTTGTMWMPVRHQILRHLDAALEIRGNRSLYGFFMVEGKSDGSLPGVWRDACASTLSEEALSGSLPHRGPGDQEVIRNAFLGAVSWQAACDVLGVPHQSLPNTVSR